MRDCGGLCICDWWKARGADPRAKVGMGAAHPFVVSAAPISTGATPLLPAQERVSRLLQLPVKAENNLRLTTPLSLPFPPGFRHRSPSTDLRVH